MEPLYCILLLLKFVNYPYLTSYLSESTDSQNNTKHYTFKKVHPLTRTKFQNKLFRKFCCLSYCISKRTEEHLRTISTSKNSSHTLNNLLNTSLIFQHFFLVNQPNFLLPHKKIKERKRIQEERVRNQKRNGDTLSLKPYH